MGGIMANKGKGFKFILVSLALTIIITIMYIFFGVASSTTVPMIIVCLIADIALSAVLFIYEGFISDYIVVAKAVLIGIALALFAGNSIGDVTEFVTGVGMYGDASNVYMRAVLVVLMLVDAIVVFIASAKERAK